jgi:hypothetical protein
MEKAKKINVGKTAGIKGYYAYNSEDKYEYIRCGCCSLCGADVRGDRYGYDEECPECGADIDWGNVITTAEQEEEEWEQEQERLCEMDEDYDDYDRDYDYDDDRDYDYGDCDDDYDDDYED